MHGRVRSQDKNAGSVTDSIHNRGFCPGSVLVVLLAACRDTAPFADAPLTIRADVEDVSLGQAFPLTVVRTWTKGLPPGDWRDDVFATRLLATSRREEGNRVEETTEYAAYAFSLEDVGNVKVKRALDPESPGAPELPDLPGMSPWWLLSVAVIALLLVRLRRKRAPPAPPPAVEPPPAPPHTRALLRLQELRGRSEDFYRDATRILRDYVGELHAVDATVMTTQQLIARHAALADVLRHCDLVQFAKQPSTEADRDRVLDAFEAFVKESA